MYVRDTLKPALCDGKRAVAAAQRAPRGQLRVTTVADLGSACLAPLVADFVRAHPQVSVDLELTDRVVDLVEEGFDVALRAGALPPSSLIARRR